MGEWNVEGGGGLLDPETGITWPQFLAWVEYAQVDPFGSERGDIQAALVASGVDNVSRTLINVNMDRSKSNLLKPASLSDFLLKFHDGTSKRVGVDGSSGGPSGDNARPGGRRRILSAEGWQRALGQVKGFAEINAATRKTRDRITGEIRYE
jgi:hypothetical protein